MKKFVSVLLMLALALSMSIPAFAADKTSKGTKADTSNKKTEVSAPANPRPNAPEINVTEAEAEQIALDDAGFASNEIKGIHAYKLYERGNAYAYRVEFAVYDRANRQTTVYTYEISLVDGAITLSNSVVR